MGKQYRYSRYFILPAVIAALLLLLFLYFPKKSSRPQADVDYAAQIIPEISSLASREGERIAIKFKLKNIGRKTWPAQGENACQLSYHILDEAKNNIRFDNARYPLPRDIRPHDEVAITANVNSPYSPGNFFLEFDLLREGIAWFKDPDSEPALIHWTVDRLEWPEDETTRFSSQTNNINTAYKMIRLTLENRQVEFTGGCGNIVGFSPGVDYPQIWIRDAGSILPASRFFYPLEWLNSWLEEFLCRQQDDGSIEDWIDSNGKTDKNTAASDQETYAVQTAYQVFTLTGPDWLQHMIKQKKIIDRLEAALEYLLRKRSDSKTGLIIRAHTADWGDVNMLEKGQDAVYSNNNTIWTAGIYDQAMFYQAAVELAEMLIALELENRAAYWTDKAATIKSATDKYLWQEDKGFYRIHIHITSYKHDFAEEDMFALGGNTQAVLSGLADSDKCTRIFACALARQEKYAVSTISGTLLPPYPSNTYQHALLDTPYEYQNGGQWDWFGNKLIYALFARGFSSDAAAKLSEVLEKNAENLGLYEWENREGIARGSADFCATAGSLGLALFSGLFGIIIEPDTLSLEPKLGTESASLHVYQPINRLSIDYDYRYDRQLNRIEFTYESSFPGSGMIKILLPEKLIETAKPAKSFRLILDGQVQSHQLETRGNDLYLTFSSDFRRHNAVIESNGR